MRHILNPKNAQQLDKNLNLAMPTFGPTNREYYSITSRVNVLSIKRVKYISAIGVPAFVHMFPVPSVHYITAVGITSRINVCCHIFIYYSPLNLSLF